MTNAGCVESVRPEYGATNMIYEVVVARVGILANFEEQIRVLWDVDLSLRNDIADGVYTGIQVI